jgi:hypothetical protein
MDACHPHYITKLKEKTLTHNPNGEDHIFPSIILFFMDSFNVDVVSFHPQMNSFNGSSYSICT